MVDDIADDAPAGGQDSQERVLHTAMRGVVGAMAMTGMRRLTTSVGLVKETPPRAIVRQTSKGVFRVVPKGMRGAAVELMHWGYGAAGGAAFSVLPEEVRLKRWAGPVYGVVLWLGFELVQAPLMGLEQSKKARPVERAALAVDHLLYGLVLAEMRARPRE